MDGFDKENFLRKNATLLVILAALIIFGLVLFKGWDKIVNEEIDGMVTTITGNFSCLPLKIVSGDEEEDVCTLGVRSRDGLYYALDISRIQDANTDLKAEDTIAVTGTIKPESEVATSEWFDYDITGVIMVNTLLHTR